MRVPDIREALALHQAGQLPEAEGLYQAIVAVRPADFNALHLLGVLWTHQGRYDEAVATISKALMLDPRSFDAHYNLGNALNAMGRHNDAVASFRRALDIKANHPLAYNNLGIALYDGGKIDDAIMAFGCALVADQNYAEAHFNLARLLALRGKHELAIAGYRRAIALKPDYVDAHINLGAALQALVYYDEAADSLNRALLLRPDSVEALNNLGVVLREMGKCEESVSCFKRALTLDPHFASAYGNLCAVLQLLKRDDEAIGCLENWLKIQPDNVNCWNILGTVQTRIDRYEDAASSFRSSLAIRPTVDAHAGLAYALLRTARGAEAVASYQQALALDPDNVSVHSDYVYALDFVPELGFVEHQAERRRWYEHHARKLASEIEPHGNDRTPDRKLRIGYVSADFNGNSPSLVFGPVLRHHDRSKFDLVLYSENRFESPNTKEFREMASPWRDTMTLSDREMVRQIRDDGIDILVDLSGHSYGNRLLVFARKPAPVQVTAWGMATGTGVPTIDYFLSDPVSVPESARPYFAEKIFDLPCILGPVIPEHAPAVESLPYARGAPFTFGCLNRLNKITDRVVALWARLLREVPDSRLLLKDAQLSDPSERHRMTSAFRAQGISEDRLILLPRTPRLEHLAAFGRVDIALDPFPTTGGISTQEAMWMGVPVVVMLGNGIPSRASAAMVSAVGLADWVAANEDEYVDIAKRFAADPVALAKLRGSLRPSMASSPLGDAVKYCRAVEDGYRTMWRRWCQTEPTH